MVVGSSPFVEAKAVWRPDEASEVGIFNPAERSLRRHATHEAKAPCSVFTQIQASSSWILHWVGIEWQDKFWVVACQILEKCSTAPLTRQRTTNANTKHAFDSAFEALHVWLLVCLHWLCINGSRCQQRWAPLSDEQKIVGVLTASIGDGPSSSRGPVCRGLCGAWRTGYGQCSSFAHRRWSGNYWFWISGKPVSEHNY